MAPTSTIYQRFAIFTVVVAGVDMTTPLLDECVVTLDIWLWHFSTSFLLLPKHLLLAVQQGPIR